MKNNPESFLLPSRFKMLGLSTAAVAILAIAVSFLFAEEIGIDKGILLNIGKLLFLFGLLFASFSKEKKESLHLKKLRLKNLTSAIIFGSVMTGLDLLWKLVYRSDLETKSGYEILVMILIYYLLLFNFNKPKKTESSDA